MKIGPLKHQIFWCDEWTNFMKAVRDRDYNLTAFTLAITLNGRGNCSLSKRSTRVSSSRKQRSKTAI